jgi:hypothetical protein
MNGTMDADAHGAAVAAAAQRIAAVADQDNISITPEQCERLAEAVVRFMEGFLAGIRHATGQPPSDSL